jgi:hypothetical protein
VWKAPWPVACLGIAMAALAATAVLADSYAERAAQVASLSPERKAELLRKKERFDKLSEDDKKRLRDMHAELSSSPDSAALEGLMHRYCDWLKNLSSRDRDEVLTLPIDKRIERIKMIIRVQEGQRFRDFVNYSLPPSDQELIYAWLDDFVARNESQILDAIRDDRDRRRIQGIDDGKARRKALIQRLPLQRFEPKMPYPSSEETERMVATLSKETQTRLGSSAGSDRNERMRELVGAAIMSVTFPPPSEEELRKFFAGLPTEDKGRLEEMEPEQMRRSLRYMYRSKQFQAAGYGGPRGRRGDGRGDDHGPRPLGPPPGPPPPGLASPKD